MYCAACTCNNIKHLKPHWTQSAGRMFMSMPSATEGTKSKISLTTNLETCQAISCDVTGGGYLILSVP